MSTPIISVTEDRVTVTANDTEANIRAAAGFTEADKTDDKADPEPAKSGQRNEDGTFKAKAENADAKADKLDAEAKPAESGDPRKSHQAKINQAIAKQRDAERRAEEAERRAATHEAELQSYRQPKPPPSPQPVAEPKAEPRSYAADALRYQAHPDAPKLDEFTAADDPYASYQAAMAVFVADQRFMEREQRTTQAKEHQTKADSIRQMYDALESSHPGATAMLDGRVYPPAVIELVIDESVRDPHLSAELLFHLATHQEDAATLSAQTTPIAAAREIGRLIARLSSASSGPETAPSQTNAKPLIKPVRPSIMAPDTAAPEDLPFGPKYIQAMNERDRKARENRSH